MHRHQFYHNLSSMMLNGTSTFWDSISLITKCWEQRNVMHSCSLWSFWKIWLETKCWNFESNPAKLIFYILFTTIWIISTITLITINWNEYFLIIFHQFSQIKLVFIKTLIFLHTLFFFFPVNYLFINFKLKHALKHLIKTTKLHWNAFL